MLFPRYYRSYDRSMSPVGYFEDTPVPKKRIKPDSTDRRFLLGRAGGVALWLCGFVQALETNVWTNPTAALPAFQQLQTASNLHWMNVLGSTRPNSENPELRKVQHLDQLRAPRVGRELGESSARAMKGPRYV